MDQTDTPVQGEELKADESKTDTRRQQKAAQKQQKRLLAEFADAMEDVQKQQESRMTQGGAGALLARERRKALKDVLKVVNDSSSSLEERMRRLQARFVGLLQDQLRHDKQVVDLQAQLDGSHREVEAGRAELGRSQQKVDSLQKLAKGLTSENRILSDELTRLRQHTDKMQGLLQGITERIEDQQQESHKVLEHNKVLMAENQLIKAKLTVTEELLEELRTNQQARISALADQLQQQNDAMSKAAKVHESMDSLLKENQALTLKAALANSFKERNEVLEKAFAEAQAQNSQHRAQMQDMQDSLKKATKVVQTFEKMQKTMGDQQQLTTQLMQERQLLQQQVQLLQQQGRDQADRLRRTQLQKQRLEGLCRTLQARAGAATSPGADSTLPGTEASSGDIDRAAEDSSLAVADSDGIAGAAESSGSHSQQPPPIAAPGSSDTCTEETRGTDDQAACNSPAHTAAAADDVQAVQVAGSADEACVVLVSHEVAQESCVQ